MEFIVRDYYIGLQLMLRLYFQSVLPVEVEKIFLT